MISRSAILDLSLESKIVASWINAQNAGHQKQYSLQALLPCEMCL